VSGRKQRAGGKSGAHRKQSRRVEPYAWLGAGVFTVGLGAAVVAGSGSAHADADGSDTSVSPSRETGGERGSAAANGSGSREVSTAGPARAGGASPVASVPGIVRGVAEGPAPRASVRPAQAVPAAAAAVVVDNDNNEVAAPTSELVGTPVQVTTALEVVEPTAELMTTTSARPPRRRAG